MTNLEILLLVILYVILAVIAYKKQAKTTKDEAAWLVGFFAPITLVFYAIRATFFEDWK